MGLTGQKGRKVRYLIIGAGPTGLAAARHLLQSGESDLLVVERNKWPGGLSASFRDKSGFLWDLGGHVIHSHYPEYDRLLDELLPQDGWHRHRREAWIYLPDCRVPYPFQLHLGWLPEDKRERCEEGLKAVRAGAGKKVENFHDWILKRFGVGITELFLEPYNRKLWNCPLSELGVYWVDDRVALPSREESKATAPRRPWGPNAYFRFPRRGGTGAICRALAERIGSDRIQYGCEIERIDLNHHKAISTEGTAFSYDVLLSTMPLAELVKYSRLSTFKPDVIDKLLRPVPIVVVGLGLAGPRPEELDDVTWMYLPDSQTGIYRVTVFSRYSPANVPDPDRYWSLMFELSNLPAGVDIERLADDTIRDARRYGLLLGKTKIVSRWARYLPYAFPVPTRDRDELRPVLLEKLAGHDVYSRGRFGSWMYEVGNMDHCMMQGIEWVKHLLTGSEEVTINDPLRVNRAPSNR